MEEDSSFGEGYFNLFAPTIDKIVLNVDLKAGVMYKAGPLVMLCLDFLGKDVNSNPVVFLSPGNFLRGCRHELKKFLMGLRIHVRSTGNKTRSIAGLSEQAASSISFPLNGIQTTVAQYYASIGLPLRYSGLICVQVCTSPIGLFVF